MVNSIVDVTVTTQQPPAPNTLQRTGAMISQGGTTFATNTLNLITQPSDLTPNLTPAKAITSLTWSGSVVTAATAAPHGITIGQAVRLTIAGATPTGYNGTYLATSTGASAFTYPLVSNPGAETVPGTYVPQSVSEITAMAATFFDQGRSLSVYVFETGLEDRASGVTALGTYIAANPNEIYSWLVPRGWAGESTFFTFMAGFLNDTSKTYFWCTPTTSNYTTFTALQKCAFCLVEAPAVAAGAVAGTATEFSCAAPFWRSLNYKPSSTNRVTPFAYGFLFGVTPYPLSGNGALFATLKAASINWVGTGAEGGLSDAILFYGTMKDGKQFNYWYSVDWIQIDGDEDLANAVIEGSNTPINPLYYNQQGIDRLLQTLFNTVTRGVTYGLILFPPIQVELNTADLNDNVDNGVYSGVTVVNAIPFIQYTTDNPSDFPVGEYDGLSVDLYTPNQGFIHLVFNVSITQFVQ